MRLFTSRFTIAVMVSNPFSRMKSRDRTCGGDRALKDAAAFSNERRLVCVQRPNHAHGHKQGKEGRAASGVVGEGGDATSSQGRGGT